MARAGVSFPFGTATKDNNSFIENSRHNAERQLVERQLEEFKQVGAQLKRELRIPNSGNSSETDLFKHHHLGLGSGGLEAAMPTGAPVQTAEAYAEKTSTREQSHGLAI